MTKVYIIPPETPNAFATPATAHMFIVNPLIGSGLMSLFSTHPPMAERVQRLEEMANRQRR